MERYQPDQYGRMMPDAHGQWVSLRAAEITALDAAQKSSADAQATVEALQKKYDDLLGKYRQLVDFYDKHNGTPCEQIRHQQQVEALQAQLEAAERHNTILQDANKVALEKVEALQRERDVWREKATHRGKVAHDLQTQLTEWHTKYITLQSALDAEREKVKGLEDKLRAMYANHPEASCYGAMPKLRAQLTQLQALVRALVGTKSFTINGPDIRTMSGNVLYACSSQTSAERLGALLEYRERTLDATTPAAKGGNGE